MICKSLPSFPSLPRSASLSFAAPQVRGDLDFYPSALARGTRSEQALTLALAEMEVQGVSTRKASAIMEEASAHSQRH